jgi:hypothetical protein
MVKFLSLAEYKNWLQNDIFEMEFALENNISLRGFDMSLVPARLDIYKKELKRIEQLPLSSQLKF